MGLLDGIRKILGGTGQREEAAAPEAPRRYIPPAAPSTQVQSSPLERAPDEGRRMIQPVLLGEGDNGAAQDKILVKAQPSRSDDLCTFMLNREVLEGYSWFFRDASAAKDSPLAEAIFAMDSDVESVLLFGSTVTLTRKDKRSRDWLPLAKKVGALLRSHLEAGKPAIDPVILQSMPSEDEIRTKIESVITNEINPGLAGHGGNVQLLGVEGNTVRLQMGGGCQGCASAAMTMRMGIEEAIRRQVPQLGAVLDETDHAAGENPYFR